MFEKYRSLGFMVSLLVIMTLCVLVNNVFADEIYLKNKDKISGEITKENKNNILVKTEAMGEISIRKEFVDSVIKSKKIASGDIKGEPQGPHVSWQGEISAGYNDTRGNTENGQFSLDAFVNRNRKHIDEWTFKGNIFYSESNKKMDAQKWYGMGRYAFSFGLRKAWYNFYRLETNHDKFADVYYRLIPSSGLGYWFFDLPKTKLLAEVGLGLEYTEYYGDKDNTNNVVAIPRLFYEQELFERAKFTQDFYIYPTLTDSGSYRLHSESAFTLSINDRLGLRLSLVDDYNSEPPEGTKQNDLVLKSSVVYSFGK